jgi:hypothetical protein
MPAAFAAAALALAGLPVHAPSARAAAPPRTAPARIAERVAVTVAAPSRTTVELPPVAGA